MSHNLCQRVIMRMLSNPVKLRRRELLHRSRVETRASRSCPLVDSYCAGSSTSVDLRNCCEKWNLTKETTVFNAEIKWKVFYCVKVTTNYRSLLS